MLKSIKSISERLFTKKHRALIIDDDRSIRNSLQIHITNKFSDLKVDMAASGNEGIELLKKNNYDLVITDMSMKQGTGTDVILFINENNIKTKLAVLTADTSQKLFSNLKRLKIRLFIKPISFKSLIEYIEGTIYRKQS